MPLKIRRRKDTGALEIYGTVRVAGTKVGVRIRERAASDKEELARQEAVLREAEIVRNHHLGERPDTKTFAEAVRSYLEFETRSTRTQKTLIRIVRHFGAMRLDQINQEALDKARSVILRDDASPGTVTRNLVVPVRAIMVHAARRGWCAVPLFDAPGSGETRPEFLLPHEADALIAAAAPHLQPLIRFLLCTGCRLGEALGLEWRSVDLAGRRVILWEGETKGGRRRVIDLVPAAVGALEAVGHRTGRVFLTARKEAYRSSEEGGGQIKTGWRSACRRSGVAAHGPHVLRHSWASWYYALNPDPLRLMEAGGWSHLSLVQRYAKIMPAGQDDAIRAFLGLAVEVRKEMRA